MNFLSSLTSKPSDYLKDNVQQISNFPADNEHAQIKANYWGQLVRADGRGTQQVEALLTWTSFSTALQGTLEVVNATFQTVQKNFNDDLEKIMPPDTKVIKLEQLTPEKIQAIKDDFQDELSMLEGLKNINKVYHDRYNKHDERQKVLKDLERELEEREAVIKAHGEVFMNVLDAYKQKKAKGEVSDLLNVSTMNPKAGLTINDAQTRLDAYLIKWNPTTMDSSEVRAFIKEGKQIYKEILTGKISSPEKYGKGSAHAVTALTWFLMDIALKKGQGHEQGAFCLEDKDSKLYNFLLKAEGCGDRESSHFIERSDAWTGGTKLMMKSAAHKGIDVLNGLPAGKRHLLFGQVNTHLGEKNKILFLKLEDFSPFTTTAYGYDMLMHGADLVMAQYNKKFNPGSDDAPEMAKERVPNVVLKAFEQIVNVGLKGYEKSIIEPIVGELEKKGFPKDDPIKASKIWGIAYMTAFITEVSKGEVAPIPLGFNTDNFETSLSDLKLDHMELRTGREVYITQDDLNKIFYTP